MSFKLAAAVLALALVLAPGLASSALADDATTPTSTLSGTSDPTPEADPKPASTPEASAAPEPKATSTPEPTPDVEPSPKPDPTANPEPTSDPQPAPSATPTPGPTTAPTPAPASQPAPVPNAAPVAPSHAARMAADVLRAPGDGLVTFAPGFDGSWILDADITVTGTSDPEFGGTLYGRAGEQVCTASVDLETGAWSCDLTGLETQENLTFTLNTASDNGYEVIGSATVHVLRPPTVDGLGDDSTTVYVYEPFPTVYGTAEPSLPGQTSTVEVIISDGTDQVSCLAIVDEEGQYSCTYTEAFQNDTYELYVEQQPYWSGTNRSYPAGDPIPAFIRIVTADIFVNDLEEGNQITASQGTPLELTGFVEGEIPREGLSVTAEVSTPGSTPIALACEPVTEDRGFTCELGASAPAGYYDLALELSQDSGLIAVNRSITVAVLGAPTFAATPTAEVNTTVRVSGTRIAGQAVSLEARRGTTVIHTFEPCTTSNAGNPATWACTYPLTGTGLVVGQYDLAASQSYRAGDGESPDAVVQLTITAAVDTTPTNPPSPPPSDGPTNTPSPTPTPDDDDDDEPEEDPTPAPLDWSVTLGGSDGPLHPGDTFTIGSSGLPTNTVVDAEIHSTPMALGSTTVGSDGTFALTATVPLTIEPGDHEIVVTVTPPGQAASVSRTPITIEAAPVVSTPTPTPTPVDPTVDGTIPVVRAAAPDIENPRNAKGAPNGLSESIAPFWDVLSSPVAIGSSIIAGLAFLVLVAFPSELLTAAIKDRYKFMQRRASTRQSPEWWTRLSGWFTVRPILSGIGLMAFATLIAGFADPDFGFDLASLRMLIACFIAAIVVSYGTYVVVNQIMNRRWSLPTTISLRPFTIIITIVGIILSRVLDFSPGFLFGLMLGLSFPPQTTPALRSRARMIRTFLTLGIAFVAWFAYSFVSLLNAGTDPAFFAAVVQDTLAALSTEGLTGILIAMLPFLYLDGQDIWGHSKKLWAGVYAIVALSFFLVVAPKPDSWSNLGDKYGPWLLLLSIFTVVALALYFGLRISERRARQREDAAEGSAVERELQH